MPTVKGVIGVSGAELARYAIFYDSLLHLATPPLTALIQARGANIAENRNGIAERALKMGAEWILYLDDDQVLAPHTLIDLLARNKDVISGLYVQREAPFTPLVFDQEDSEGYCLPRLLERGDRGLVSVKATGAGCMLVATNVLRAMEEPWWRLGQITKDGWGDDLNFCHRVREAGFEVWCDLDVVVGHQTNGTLWPKRGENGEWSTILVPRSDMIAEWPAAMRSPLVGVA
jgi:hypothetical protein